MKTFDERIKNIQDKVKVRKRKKTVLTVAVPAICVFALLLILFVPYSTNPPSVRQYAGSPYYQLIQKLNEYTYEAPRYKNNFQAMVAGLSSLSLGKDADSGEMMPPVPDANRPVSSPAGPNPDSDLGTGGQENIGSGYQEVTDNQVTGVIEADIFKRSDRHIYHLTGNVLDIYTIAGADSALLSRINLTEFVESCLPKRTDANSMTDVYFSPVEMYLSQDCKTVTLIGDAGYIHKTAGMYSEYYATALISLDVSVADQVRLLNKQLITGNYVSSRMVNGEILLVCRQNNYRNSIDFDDESSFVPQYGWFEDLKPIGAEHIVLPEKADNANYTVVAKLGADLGIRGIQALLSYSQNVYVSQDQIFLTHAYTHEEENLAGTKVVRKQMTEISGICYSGEGLELLGTVCVEGSVKDQYSMDAYQGILRAVTTVRESVYYPVTGITSALTTQGDNANLYCIDLENWEICGSVLAFAPEGESVTSVRFDGSKAYVCTAELAQMTDPVYFFDLSDPSNITYTDTGTIDGYSSSLIQFGNGNLLGIGFNERRELKLEVYRQGAQKVESVCSFEKGCDFSQVYKSYYVDRENQYIGLGIYDWEDGKCHYLLLHFDGAQLVPVIDLRYEDDAWGMNSFRADIIDGYLYILWRGLDVVKL